MWSVDSEAAADKLVVPNRAPAPVNCPSHESCCLLASWISMQYKKANWLSFQFALICQVVPDKDQDLYL